MPGSPVDPPQRHNILRRSIGDDTVYRFVLREQLGYLIDKRLNLEWYIEGGRSLVDAFEQLDYSA